MRKLLEMAALLLALQASAMQAGLAAEAPGYFFRPGGGSGTISSGTANRIPRYTAATTIGNGSLTDDGVGGIGMPATAAGANGNSIIITTPSGGTASSHDGYYSGGFGVVMGSGSAGNGTNKNGGDASAAYILGAAGGVGTGTGTSGFGTDISFVAGTGGASSGASGTGGRGGIVDICIGAGGAANGGGAGADGSVRVLGSDLATGHFKVGQGGIGALANSSFSVTDGDVLENNGNPTTCKFQVYAPSNNLNLASDMKINWGTASSWTFLTGPTVDTGIARSAAGIVKFTNGGAGSGGFLSQKGSSVVGSADEVQLTVKGNGTQTSNIFEVQSSDASKRVAVDNTGGVNFPYLLRLSGTTVAATSNADAKVVFYAGTPPNWNFANDTGFAWWGDAFVSGTQTTNLSYAAEGVLRTAKQDGTNETWLQQTPARRRRAATQTVTDTTTLAADDTLSVTVYSGRKYSGKLCYYFTTTVNSSGAKVDLAGGAATFTSFEGCGKIYSTSAGTFLGAVRMSAANTAVGFTATGTTACVEIDFSFICNAGGTFKPQFAQNAETGAAESVVAGVNSFLVMEDMP